MTKDNNSKNSENPIWVFDITIKEETNAFDSVKKIFKDIAKKWAFQKEKGELTGYVHWQCRISLKQRKRLGEFRKLLFTKGLKDFEPSCTSKENCDNDFYVLKEDTRLEGPWTDQDPEPPYIPRQIREIQELRPWQKMIVENRNVWDTRTINLIYDESGNHGKSILKTYIGVHQLGRSIPFMNDYRDMMRMVMDTKKEKLYIIDVPRALRKDQLFQFFSGIETLKDGYAYDDRYHFKEEYFDCPNIWIFMNIIPDTSYLSNDRWKIWTFDDNSNLKQKEV